MNKKLQKLAAFVAACMLMVSTVMGVGVYAAPNNMTGIDFDRTTGTLKLNANVTGKSSTYTAYKVLDAIVDKGQDMYEYAFTKDFENAGVTLDAIKDAKGQADYQINDSLDKIAATLENHVKTNNLTGTTLTVGEAKELSLGYYLILETKMTSGYKQTKPMLVAIPGTNAEGKYVYDVTVTMKDQPLATKKTIVESTTTGKDSIAQQVEKEFTFQIVQDVPVYDDTYKDVVFRIEDTMDKGLAYVKDSVTVKVSGKEAALTADQYKFTEGTDEKGNTRFTFDFSKNNGNPNYYQNVKGAAQVTITYKAKLTKNANFAAGEVNSVYAVFGENPNNTTTGTVEKAKAFAGGLQLTKVGEKGKDDQAAPLLQGAEFTVYTDKDCKEEAKLVVYTVGEDGKMTATRANNLSATATTDVNGVVRFDGLGEGTYYIKETKAPNGYIRLKKPIQVVVKATLPDEVKTGEETAAFTYEVSGNGIAEGTTVTVNGNVGSFTVQNTKGFTLPTTGGAGTYVFTIGGVLLIAAAAVVVIRARKNGN